jgi:hypothetical protein
LQGGLGGTAALERFIEYAAGHERVWFARRIDIARHWIATHPSPGERQSAAPQLRPRWHKSCCVTR